MAIALCQRQVAADYRGTEPLYFRSGEYRLFGWLHRSTPKLSTNVGLVLCKPFGYESICAHRSISTFARAAANIGIPCLRFDYLGTGDSDDIEPAADQLATWTGDVLAAVSELRRATGVERVCLLGFRLGALLATLAGVQCDALAGLAVVAPVISGPRYLRELRVAQLAAAQAAIVPRAARILGKAQPSDVAYFEASGFSLSRATIDALSRTDLATLSVAPTREMLIIDRSDLPGADVWADTMAKFGARAQYHCLPGAVQMLSTAAHFAVLPQAMIAATTEWLSGIIRLCGAAHSRTAADEWRPECSTVLQLTADPVTGKELTERPVLFGSDPALFGIVTEPSRGEARRRGVILLNGGADYHIGNNRMHVSLARRWARSGYVVLRMDLAGLGDSGTRPDRPEDEVYPPSAVDDIRAAIEFMRGCYRLGDITLAGLCSGAYHALRAATAGVAVSRILMVNPQTFFWREGTRPEDIQSMELVRAPSVYRERALSLAHWKKLLTGRADIWRIAKVSLSALLLPLVSRVREVLRFLHIRLPNDLGWELQEIARRGIRAVFIFGRGEEGIDLLKIHAGSSVRHLGEHCRVHIIDDADHVFSQKRSREILENLLSDELFTRMPHITAPCGVSAPERP